MSENDVVPRKVAVQNAKLKLSWNDREITLDGPTLRAACRCAQCRMVRIKSGASIDAPLASSDVFVTSAVSMGYGLQLHFSDGHDRGIFPWAYLHELASLVSSVHEPSHQTSA